MMNNYMYGLKQVCVAVKKNLKTIIAMQLGKMFTKCHRHYSLLQSISVQPYHYKWLQSDIQYIQNMKNTWLTAVVYTVDIERSTS